MRVFLAGATGAIGRSLLPQLLKAGHHVIGTTRSAARALDLESAGAEAVVVDVCDAGALAHAVASARPEMVIDQLTDLPAKLDPARMEQALRRNARIRTEGTRNLIAAMSAARVRGLIAQSIAWIYAAGPEPHGESDPLDSGAGGARRVTVEGVTTMERLILGSPVFEGVILRYGHLYGPGTGADAADAPSVHVDAAAGAALLAIQGARPGLYNVAEPCAYLSSEKAKRELGWDPWFRRPAPMESASESRTQP
jgi:nucleoside-diphosphate-sugar epimerase